MMPEDAESESPMEPQVAATQVLVEIEDGPKGAAQSNSRLVGFDLARCIAFFGMVVVNYRYLMGGYSGQPEWLLSAFEVVTGRAAATFVILAGIGISLFYEAKKSGGAPRIGLARLTAPMRPLLLVAFFSVSWIATDFYVAEKAEGRPFNFGPLAREVRTPKDKEPVAALSDRFCDHLSAIKGGEISVFLETGMWIAGSLLLLFLVFRKSFRSARGILFKRSLFLASFGYLWYPAWSFDILHYYGFYLLAGCLFLSLRSRWVSLAAIGILAGAFWFQFSRDVTESFQWISVWEGWGAAKNLFIGGFHPVLPWLAFLLLGICLGRLDSNRPRTRIAFIVIGLAMAISGHLVVEPLSYALDPEAYTRHASIDLELVLKDKELRSRGRKARPPRPSSSNATPTSGSPDQDGKKKGPPPPEPLPLSIPVGFPQDAHAAFMGGVEKLRVDLVTQGPWKERKLRVAMAERDGVKKPVLVMSVSYGEGNPAPTSHKRDWKSSRSRLRRSVIYNEKEAARDKKKAAERGKSADPSRFRNRKAWPASVPIIGLERRMPIVGSDEASVEVVWDTTWIDADVIRNPTAAQRLATMNGLSSEGNGPYYMFTAIGTSLTIIGICLILGSIGRLKRFVLPFVRTGQMTLSLYICHAAVGFYVLKWIDMTRGNDLRFIAFYVVTCWIVSVALAHAWRAFLKRGPFEYVMRWMTD